MENFGRELESIKKNQIKISEIKYIKTKTKNLKRSSESNQAKERISELEERLTSNAQTGKEKKKDVNNRKKKYIRDTWSTVERV